MERDEILSSFIMELRRGTIVLCVLKTLKEPMYGYSLVSVLGQKGIPAEANTLYPLLRRLESQGLLKSEWEMSGSKPRKYYVTTDDGKEMCELLKKQWDKTVESMNEVMEGEGKNDE